MARQVLPIVGAVVGGFIGGPAGAQWGYAIGSVVGGIVDPIEMQGRKLGDAPTQVAAEGGARAIVFGKGCVRALVILERGGRRVIKQRQSSGGKGSGPTTVNERALWTYAIGLCEAIPGGSILRIWEDEKLVYDVTPESVIVQDSAKYGEGFRWYDGGEAQLPDPALESLHGAGNAPYYRGTAYLVFPQRDLTDFGERVPTYRIEVAAVSESSFRTILARGRVGSGQPRFFPSEDGTEFEQVETAPVYYAGMFAANDGRIINAGSDGGQYTDDAGSSWLNIPSLSSVRPNGRGVAFGNMVILPSGSDLYACHVSSNNGVSFQSISGSPKYELAYNGVILAGATANQVARSLNSGGFWESPVLVPEASVGSGMCMIEGPGGFLYGARRSTTNSACVWGSNDALDWDPVELPGGSGKSVTQMCAGRISGQTVIVAYGNGSMWCDDGDGWATVDGAFPPLTGITFTGQRFIASVNTSGGPTYTFYTSEDGLTWTERSSSIAEQMTYIRSSYGFAQARGLPIALSSVISTLHLRCGHSLDDFDASSATELINGCVIEQTVTGAEAINSVNGAFFLDPSDYDGKIRYIRRGLSSVATLSTDDLIEEPESARRNNAIEYPRKLHLFYQSSTNAYATTKATSARYSADVSVIGEASVSTPVTFDDLIKPAEIAAKLHKVLWAEAEGEIEWHVTDEWLSLVPSDPVTLNHLGMTTRARVVQVQFEPGQLRLKMKVDRQSAYSANITQVVIPPAPTPPQPATPADTVLAVMDLPALTDNADTLNYYAAMSGETDNWAGAILQQSLDAGATFVDIGSASVNAIMGELLEDVTAASEAYTDTTNSVVVQLYTSDELESRSQVSWLSQGGAFALSWIDDGQDRWELMQFRDAEEIGENTYRLSHLMRGRKGTEAAAHPAGARFVFLDSTVLRLAAQSAWIGTDLYHRAVSNGLSPESAEIQDDLYTGQSQREWPVAHLMLSSMAGLITAEAIPRNRFGTSMNPVRSVNWIGYRWAVSDGANTINRDGTSAIETFDVSSWTSPVTVTVSQLNRITGPGPSVSEEIDV